ncbi:MAG: DUF2283 domain-containing protein [Chloroflexi bacterium]|nr:DUF2283 domain-containing protein [Chloroflexota bacterium]
MKISYDPEADALYIRLIAGRQECRTLRLNEEVALDVGPGEVLVGIEILDASHVLGDGEAPGCGTDKREGSRRGDRRAPVARLSVAPGGRSGGVTP